MGSLDIAALKLALLVSGLNYFLSVYLPTALSVLWQTWGNMLPTRAQAMLSSREENKLWYIPKKGEPLTFHWLPFFSQARLRGFVIVAAVSYLMLSYEPLSYQTIFMNILLLGYAVYLFFYYPVKRLVFRKGSIDEVVFTAISVSSLACSVSLVAGLI